MAVAEGVTVDDNMEIRSRSASAGDGSGGPFDRLVGLAQAEGFIVRQKKIATAVVADMKLGGVGQACQRAGGNAQMTLAAYPVAGDGHAFFTAPEESVESIENGCGHSPAAFSRLSLRRGRLRTDIEVEPLQSE
jgi:hypothetical protein